MARVPDEFFVKNGQYMLVLDADNQPVAVYKKGDDNVYTEDLEQTPEGKRFERSTVIEVVRTGTSSICWYKTSTGKWIPVPC
jgi:hypothetical protein